MRNLEIPSFRDAGRPDSFGYRIDNTNRFKLTATFSAVSDWDNPQMRARLQDRLYDDCASLLREADFFKESQLEQRKGVDYFSVEFQDDVNDFIVSVYNNRIVVEKPGLKFERFHHWYHAAVPGFKQLFQSLLDLLAKMLERELKIVDVSYDFNFLVYDFMDMNNKVFRNYNVLSKLFSQVPKGTGEIAAMEADAKNMSRLDYKVSCWDGTGSEESPDLLQRRMITYSVQAPSNNQFTGLWFAFYFSSATYTDPETGSREGTRATDLLDEYSRAYDFMFLRGVGGFMASLLGQYQFKTTASFIP